MGYDLPARELGMTVTKENSTLLNILMFIEVSYVYLITST